MSCKSRSCFCTCKRTRCCCECRARSIDALNFTVACAVDHHPHARHMLGKNNHPSLNLVSRKRSCTKAPTSRMQLHEAEPLAGSMLQKLLAPTTSSKPTAYSRITPLPHARARIPHYPPTLKKTLAANSLTSPPPEIHESQKLDAMLLDNTLAGGCLAALLLSTAQVDAFSVHPARSIASSCTRKVAGHSGASPVPSQATPGWLSRRVFGGRPLSMTEAPGSVEEVALTHLEEREFQVC